MAGPFDGHDWGQCCRTLAAVNQKASNCIWVNIRCELAKNKNRGWKWGDVSSGV